MAREVTLSLPTTVEVLQQRLAPFVGPHKNWIVVHDRRGPLYRGTVSHQGFALQRRRWKANSFRPTTRATFAQTLEGTTVRMRIDSTGFKIALVLMVILAVTGAAISSLGVALGVASNDSSRLAWLIPVGAFVFPLLIGAIFFAHHRYATNKAERELTQILEGSVVPSIQTSHFGG